jgi:hypothetical protein
MLCAIFGNFLSYFCALFELFLTHKYIFQKQKTYFFTLNISKKCTQLFTRISYTFFKRHINAMRKKEHLFAFRRGLSRTIFSLEKNRFPFFSKEMHFNLIYEAERIRLDFLILCELFFEQN